MLWRYSLNELKPSLLRKLFVNLSEYIHHYRHFYILLPIHSDVFAK